MVQILARALLLGQRPRTPISKGDVGSYRCRTTNDTKDASANYRHEPARSRHLFLCRKQGKELGENNNQERKMSQTVADVLVSVHIIGHHLYSDHREELALGRQIANRARISCQIELSFQCVGGRAGD